MMSVCLSVRAPAEGSLEHDERVLNRACLGRRDRLDPDDVCTSVHALAAVIAFRIASTSLLSSCTVSPCQP